jgi:hypothetical protein
MTFPGRAIAFVAALAVPSAVAAQPIVSPRQVAEPSASRSTKQPPTPAAAPKQPRSKSQRTPTAPSSKPARPSTKRSGPPSKAAEFPRKPRSSSKRATKKPAPSRAGVPQARIVASAKRGRRADNMPLGFEWPPTPAMQASSTACEAELTASGVAWKHAAPEGHIAAPIELMDERIGGIAYTSKWRRPPYTLDCHLARALVQVGPQLYAIGVREIRWGSIYRWSNVRTQGREFPFLSRHALGLAMDIVEFVDDTGRVANVEQHYALGDPLLLAIEQTVNASREFRIVLTPRNDPASHHDHFHIEANLSYGAP